jgi:Tol biopolymer transport system component
MIFVIRLAARLLLMLGLLAGLMMGVGQTFLPTDEIAFISPASEANQVYILDSQRRTITRLSRLHVLDCCLAWSPDGEYLAVVSDLSEVGGWEIYSIDLAGGRQQRLTEAIGFDAWPAWSPDGKQLAFLSARNDLADIFLMKADGSQQHAIHSLNSPVRPVWSPDGRQIVYVAVANQMPGLYAVDAICPDSCNAAAQQLLDPILFLDPADAFWQVEDGGLIVAAFNRTQSGGYGIYALSSDTRQPPERLTFNSDLNPPSITGVGKLAAFVSGDMDTTTVTRQKHIYVLDTSCIGTAEGCRPALRRVAKAVGVDNGLSLSSDGRWLVFSANWSGSPELYRVRTDGSQMERLTWNEAVEMLPAWRPG